MRLVALVALGGAVGAVARYGLGGWVQGWAGWSLPWGTFAVNVLGSLLIGLSLRVIEELSASSDLRALITIGLLGAFTTFSTYAYETVALVRGGAWGRAGAYAFGSLLAGVLAVLGGFVIAEMVLRGRA